MGNDFHGEGTYGGGVPSLDYLQKIAAVQIDEEGHVAMRLAVARFNDPDTNEAAPVVPGMRLFDVLGPHAQQARVLDAEGFGRLVHLTSRTPAKGPKVRRAA